MAVSRFKHPALVLLFLNLLLCACSSRTPDGEGTAATSSVPPNGNGGEALVSSQTPPKSDAPPPEFDFTGAEYVGSQACARCGHEKVHADWANSMHNKMFQKVGPGVIVGDFNDRTLEYMEWRFRMYTRDGVHYIQELAPSGEESVYRVDYTLGSKRIQHYLSVRPDKSIRVTYPTWDIQLNKWIHGSEIVRTAHNSAGELIVMPVQVWNKHCWNCHTSQEEEGFDILTQTYDTRFTEPGINCEMCHGPGSIHVERMEKDPTDPCTVTVNAMRLKREDRMVDCLQCHTRRIIVKKGFHAGENLYDYYQLRVVDLAPQPVSAPPVWATRARRFANECLLLWESPCFVKGDATCVSCHDAHQVDMAKDPRYRNTDVLCTQCHREYLDEKTAADHTRHPLQSEGSRCVECHMMMITRKNIKVLQNAEIRDHLISSPIPESTVKHAIPNACNNACHEDKPVEWVIEWMDKWYPNRRRSDFVEDTMALARKRQPEAIPGLIRLAEDPSRSEITRAAAVSLLGEFRGEQVTASLLKALTHPHPVIRAEAARALSEAATPSLAGPLKRALSDPIRTVRLNAVFALVKLGVLEVTDEHAGAYKKAKGEYEQFLREFPTIYDTRVDLGTYLAVHGKYEEALQEYKNASKIRPELPLAWYYIGVTCARMGDLEEALKYLDEALKLDPNFRNTREIVEKIRSLR